MLYIPSDFTLFLSLSLLPVGPLLFWSESSGTFNLGYSKFADPKSKYGTIPSKLGMSLLYAPAAVLYPFCFLIFSSPWTFYHIYLMLLFSGHFLKRLYECQFVHRFSGVNNTVSTAIISLGFYGSFGVLAAYVASTVDPKTVSQMHPNYIIGTLIYLCGQAINYYHHQLLANLRTNEKDKTYKVPTGGLFQYVCCPHYAGEIIAWIGFSLIYTHIFAYCGTIMSALYLAGRSQQTMRWYETKLGKSALPAGWKNLIPYVY